MIERNQYKTENIYFEDDEDLQIISAALIRSRIWQSILSVILFVGGALLIVNSFSFSIEKVILASQVSGIIICISGILLLFNALKIVRFGSPDLLEILLYEPEKLVWVFYTVTTLMPFGIKISNRTILCLKDSKNKQHVIYVNNKMIIRLMNLLRKRLPHATFGYSSEKEFLFKVHPNLLRKF